MGFKISTVTNDGITHADAYYKVQAPRIDHTAKVAKFGLQTWHDQTARNDGKAALAGVPNPQVFRVSGSEYDTWFADAVLQGDGVSPIKQCYLYARAHDAYTEATDLI